MIDRPSNMSTTPTYPQNGTDAGHPQGLCGYSLLVERKRMIPGPDGNPVQATEIGFRSSGEHWNEYLLDDGTVVRIKLVATAAHRVDGMFDQEGNPVYVVQSTNVMNVSSPDDIKGKK